MTDFFDPIDKWDSRFNILRDAGYLRKVVFWFIVVCFFLWATFGYDSGVGMLEIWRNNWQINYAAYGVSFHFSSYIIYGFLYMAVSWYLEKNGMDGAGNFFLSGLMVLFNVVVFEWVYMTLFAYFQMRRNLLEWFITDFLFLQQYLVFFFVACLGFYIMRREGFNLRYENGMLTSIAFAVCIWGFWVGFSEWFPVETATFNGWISSPWFPQTHYAYVVNKLGLSGTGYVGNNLLHTVNLAAKGLTAFVGYMLTRCFRND